MTEGNRDRDWSGPGVDGKLGPGRGVRFGTIVRTGRVADGDGWAPIELGQGSWVDRSHFSRRQSRGLQGSGHGAPRCPEGRQGYPASAGAATIAHGTGRHGVVAPGAGFALRHMIRRTCLGVLAVETRGLSLSLDRGDLLATACGWVTTAWWRSRRRRRGGRPAPVPLVGHAVMSAAVGECHLLNLCVHPDWQGRGLGRRMLLRLFSIGRANNADTAFLEVRVQQSQGHRPLRGGGFLRGRPASRLLPGGGPAGGRRGHGAAIAVGRVRQGPASVLQRVMGPAVGADSPCPWPRWADRPVDACSRVRPGGAGRTGAGPCG